MASLSDAILVIIVLSVIIPLGSLILISFMPPGERAFPPVHYTLDNYVYVLDKLKFYQNMFNTFYFITLAVLISLVVSIPTAYAIARLPINYHLWVLTVGLVILVKSLPPGSLLVPIYDWLWRLKLTNTPLGVAISYQVYTLPYTSWLLTSFFLDLPREIEVAARLDGAGSFSRLIHVILPISIPGIISAVIMNYLNLWNEYMYSSVMVSSSRYQTAAVILGQMVSSEYVVEWGVMAAANVLSIIPALIFVSFVQKNISRAITGGIKG
ncbi:carbohydrate ABC transporter permease [Thermofilum sp.]|jgi:ABC-type glycerol-3-phosphate transport system permease component|uniref:carbohydrate ABC transporter permease n=1 Tax=Thermofilum sp. TaxID=1961369 RepID=UPI0025854C5B|nr:carbohydrate ABC transporter permease [Thermofilum sp.]